MQRKKSRKNASVLPSTEFLTERTKTVFDRVKAARLKQEQAARLKEKKEAEAARLKAAETETKKKSRNHCKKNTCILGEGEDECYKEGLIPCENKIGCEVVPHPGGEEGKLCVPNPPQADAKPPKPPPSEKVIPDVISEEESIVNKQEEKNEEFPNKLEKLVSFENLKEGICYISVSNNLSGQGIGIPKSSRDKMYKFNNKYYFHHGKLKEYFKDNMTYDTYKYNEIVDEDYKKEAEEALAKFNQEKKEEKEEDDGKKSDDGENDEDDESDDIEEPEESDESDEDESNKQDCPLVKWVNLSCVTGKNSYSVKHKDSTNEAPKTLIYFFEKEKDLTKEKFEVYEQKYMDVELDRPGESKYGFFLASTLDKYKYKYYHKKIFITLAKKAKEKEDLKKAAKEEAARKEAEAKEAELRKAEAIDAKNVELLEKNKDLKYKLDAGEKKIQDLGKKLNDDEEQIKDLKDKLAEEQKKEQQDKKKIEDLKEKLNKSLKEKEKTTALSEKVIKDFKELREKQEVVEKELEQLGIKKEVVEKELEQLDIKKEVVEKELEQLRNLEQKQKDREKEAKRKRMEEFLKDTGKALEKAIESLKENGKFTNMSEIKIDALEEKYDVLRKKIINFLVFKEDELIKAHHANFYSDNIKRNNEKLVETLTLFPSEPFLGIEGLPLVAAFGTTQQEVKENPKEEEKEEKPKEEEKEINLKVVKEKVRKFIQDRAEFIFNHKEHEKLSVKEYLKTL